MPRPDRIEEPHDHDRDPILPVVGTPQVLVQRFRRRVAPAERGAKGEIIRLTEPAVAVVRVLAIHLRGRSDQDRAAVRARRPQDVLGPVDVRLDGVDGTLEDQLHPHRCREMVDPHASGGIPVNEPPIEHRSVHEGEARMPEEEGNILGAPG